MIDCDDVVQGKSSLRLLSKNFKRVSSLIVSLSLSLSLSVRGIYVYCVCETSKIFSTFVFSDFERER